MLDPDGNPVLGEDGKRLKDTVKVMPQQIKDALAESRRRWAEEHGRDSRGLSERSEQARAAAKAMDGHRGSRPLDREQR